MKHLVQEALQLANEVVNSSEITKITTNYNITKQDLIGFIDYTSLKSSDSIESVFNLAQNTLQLSKKDRAKQVAAICVHPNFAETVSEVLKGSEIKTAVVSTSFPEGQTFLEVKLLETQLAVASGAQEIDMVINRGMLLSENYNGVFSEIVEVKKACSTAKLKVILETSDLVEEKNIAIASALALFAGTDFIKTSTGKGLHGATSVHAKIMLLCIKRFFEKTGKRIGFKAAGGISSFEKAKEFLGLTLSIAGKEWHTPTLFRIGASSLLHVLLQETNE